MSQKYEKLKSLLKELFQLDQPDLDFGLYRIMHAKAAEVTQFLDRDLLPQVVDAAEGEHGNIKPPNGKERVFTLAGTDFIALENGELNLRFEYRPATITDWPEDVRQGKSKPPAQRELTDIAEKRILTAKDAALLPWLPYKNDYKHSSFASMLHDRLKGLSHLLSKDGAIFVSIDKTERTILEHLLDEVFGTDNRIEELIWAMNTNNSQAPNYSTNHEYVLVYAKHRPTAEQDRNMFREPKPGYEDVMELIGRLNPEFPSIAIIEKEIAKLYEAHRVPAGTLLRRATASTSQSFF